MGGTSNPYAKKEYEKVEITDTFSQDYSDLLLDFSSGMTELIDTMKANMNELKSGNSISELKVFDEPYNKLYEVCYKIDNLDVSKVPGDFKESLKYFKNISKDVQTMLDDAYNWNFKDGDPSEQYVQNISVNLQKAQDSIPKKRLQLNENYDFGQIEFKLTSGLSYDKEIRSKTGASIYYEADKNNTYLKMRFEMTNKTTENVSANDLISFKLVYDGRYEYIPTLLCEQGRSFSPYTTLKPLEKVEGWIGCEVPNNVKDMDYVLSVICNDVEYIYK